jgi:hypothetical protein
MPTIVKLNKLESAGPKQTAIAERACALLQQALDHPTFPTKVKNAKYTATWRRAPGGASAQVDPARILEYIVTGVESGTAPDFEVDLHIKLARLRRGIVGSTPLGAFPIRTSYWFINSCIAEDDPVGLAAHFMHEWMHVAGFYHHGSNRARGDVAYQLGAIVARILRVDLAIPNGSVSIQ